MNGLSMVVCKTRSCQRDCAHEQGSMNPVMADANSIAESQQKPSDRPKHHPPSEPVLQVIGDLLQPFALSRRAGLDAHPLRQDWLHQRSQRTSRRGVTSLRSSPATGDNNWLRNLSHECFGSDGAAAESQISQVRLEAAETAPPLPEQLRSRTITRGDSSINFAACVCLKPSLQSSEMQQEHYVAFYNNRFF